jgi:hypothetical protein
MAFVGCCGASGVRPSALAAGIAAKASAAARAAIGPAAIAAWAQERAARAGLIAEAAMANAVHKLRSPSDPDLRVVVAELAERLAEAEARLAEGLNMSRASGRGKRREIGSDECLLLPAEIQSRSAMAAQRRYATSRLKRANRSLPTAR